MAAYVNGRVPATALETVAQGVQLLAPAARAYRGLAFVALHADYQVKPAPGVGSGYRSLTVQGLYWNAAHGDADAARKVGLSSSSSIAVAFPGMSSHGTGTRIDVLVNGSDHMPQQFLPIAHRYGWTREFGAADQNHFKHDGVTALTGVLDEDKHRIIAAYLNRRQLDGHLTGTEESGERGSYYWTRMQQAGHVDGLYPTPAYDIDGEPGPRTRWLERHYWGMLVG